MYLIKTEFLPLDETHPLVQGFSYGVNKEFEDLEFIPLSETYKLVQGFYCGDNDVDAYLKIKSNATYDHRLGFASTTTIVHKNEVVAYFTANCSHLEIPVDEARDMGIHNDVFIPAVEVKYLGVDRKHQKKGIGDYVLRYIIGKALEMTPVFACRFIFLWSVEDKIGYYQDRFFQLTGTEEYGLYLMRFSIPTYHLEEELTE